MLRFNRRRAAHRRSIWPDQRHNLQCLTPALNQVPPLLRECLVLRFQEQMKLEEIAKLIRIPVATVKTRVYRGVMALRPALKGGAR